MSEKLVISAVLAIVLLAAYGAGYVEGKDVGESTIRKQWAAEKDSIAAVFIKSSILNCYRNSNSTSLAIER